MPMEVSSPISMRLRKVVSASSVMAAVRSSTRWCAFMELVVIMTRRGSFTYSRLGTSCRSPFSTMLWEWEIRVHIRSKMGVWYSSERRNASLAKVSASWLSEGSSMGTLAEMA